MDQDEKFPDDWWSRIEENFAASFSEGEVPTILIRSVDEGMSEAEIAKNNYKLLHFPKLDPLPPNIVIAAAYRPGWSTDYSRWNLTVDQEGNLHQHISVDTPNAQITKTYQEEHNHIDTEEVVRLLEMANDFGFASFCNVVECITTDVGSARLSFRLDGQIITYTQDGSGEMSEENTKRFGQLWKEVHCHAPFPKR